MSPPPTPDLPSVADDLYGLDPAEFVAARDARSRAARDAGSVSLAGQIAALRKPTTAAWAINLLVRRRGADLQRLLSLADHLRSGDRDPARMREVSRTAQRVVTAVTRLADDLTAEHGRPLGPALSDQVRATLRAAMADPEAAAVVLSGRLVTTLQANALAGLGMGAPTDLSGAVAVPTSVTSLAARGRDRVRGGDAGRHERALATAQQERDDAVRRADEARERAERAHADVQRLSEQRDELAAAIDRARRALREQEDRLATLRGLLAQAEHARRTLDQDARAHARRAAVAAQALRELTEP